MEDRSPARNASQQSDPHKGLKIGLGVVIGFLFIFGPNPASWAHSFNAVLGLLAVLSLFAAITEAVPDGVRACAVILFLIFVLVGAASQLSTGQTHTPHQIYAGPNRTGQPTESTGTRTALKDVGREPGDLGLSTAIENLGCTGQYVLIVMSAVRPSSYSLDIRIALDQDVGSKYLMTSESCGSFTQQANDGSEIYAVYYGPFDSFSVAKTHCSAGLNDAYVKKLVSNREMNPCSNP